MSTVTAINSKTNAADRRLYGLMAGILSGVKLPAYFGNSQTVYAIAKNGTIVRIFSIHQFKYEIDMSLKGKPGYESAIRHIVTNYPEISPDSYNEKMQRVTAALDSFLAIG
jgi:hypothetical protein